jgi:hypothetical protein
VDHHESERWYGMNARAEASRTLARGARFLESLTIRPLALYGSAVLRIGYSLTFLIVLIREFPNRETLWGPSAAWTPAMEHQYAQSMAWSGWIKSWYTLLATTSDVRFQFSYDIALLICVAMALGYRTRATSILFMLVVTAFTARNPFLEDGSDNVLTLMSIYLVFVASGRRISLDHRRHKRRAARPAPTIGTRAELGELRRRAVTLAHNAAVLVIGFQMCVIYGAAGLWKAQGGLWQSGTAMYYILHVQWFQPWPGLSDYIAGNSIALCVIAYVTVFAQIGFPFALFNKRLKYVILALLLMMHIGIAVLLGIPMFSLVMVIGDSVFLPDAFWRAVGRLIRRRAHEPGPAPSAEREPESESEPESIAEPVLQR